MNILICINIIYIYIYIYSYKKTKTDAETKKGLNKKTKKFTFNKIQAIETSTLTHQPKGFGDPSCC